MKKLATFSLLLAMAMQASALSFAWKAANVAFDGTVLNGDTTLTAYLVYLGNPGALESSYSTDTIVTDMNVVQTKTGMTKKTITDTYSWNYKNNAENGDTFAILLSYASGGKTYYNLSATTYTIENVTAENSTVQAYSLAATDFNYSTKSESSTVKAGGGWTAVPEPSTAMLALAGLALLIKRRRA